MLKPIDRYFEQLPQPAKGSMEYLRSYILSCDDRLTEAWKYGMPFFCYKGRMCCYLWQHKKYKQPYIGFVEGDQMTHEALLREKRARMKIFLFDPSMDLPMETIAALLNSMLQICRSAYGS